MGKGQAGRHAGKKGGAMPNGPTGGNIGRKGGSV
jgi:hypothetical protein